MTSAVCQASGWKPSEPQAVVFTSASHTNMFKAGGCVCGALVRFSVHPGLILALVCAQTQAQTVGGVIELMVVPDKNRDQLGMYATNLIDAARTVQGIGILYLIV